MARSGLIRLALAALGVLPLSAQGVPARAGDSSAAPQPRHIVLRSSWQEVNIGDIGHTPGVLRLLERFFPEAKVTLWPMNSDPKVHELLRTAFPGVDVVRGAIDANGQPSAALAEIFREADFLLHGSGPSVVASRDLAAWYKRTGKPYGIYGVTIDPVSSPGGKATDGNTIESLASQARQLPHNHLDAGLRAVLEHARFVFCRDTLTLQYLRAQNVSGPLLEMAPDGAFGIELRDDALADDYLRAHGLEAGKFICVIPRLRYTPYYLIRGREPTQRDLDRATISARHAEQDHAKTRDMIVRVVRETGTRVLLCPEMTYQIDTARDFIANLLPPDVKPFVVLRDKFWLPDEACSIYARAAAVASLDNHSPIFALTVGTPTMYIRTPTDTIKGRMWNDVGLGDWFCEIEETTGELLASTVMTILRNGPAARERVARIMRFVRERQAASMAVVRAEVMATTDRSETAAPRVSSPDELVRLPLRQLLSLVESNPAIADQRARFIAKARADARKEVLRRPRNLQELRAWRVPLKYEVRPPHLSALADREWEIFSLSQGDNKAGDVLKIELPRLAAAATLTRDPALLDRVIAQLGELATWSPLERRGWSLRNTSPRLVHDDGAWLGTGRLVRAMLDAADLLPPEKLPAGLHSALAARLEAEVALMNEDWATRRAWYIRDQAAHSNQWILPHEALVRAILFLGVDRHRESYERGIANLIRSMDVQGGAGEFVEGLRYSGLSLESLYSVARATARAGDDRLRSHPFLQKFPTWLVHHFQPGGFLINAFDSPHSSRGYLSRDQALMASAALVTGSPHALWGLRTRAGFGATLDGMAAATLPASTASEPPLHAHYPMATRINWRSSWDDDTATGMWIRGGHPTDRHDHMDRGHVNFIIGSRALLIEAGTLTYAVPAYATHMRSVAGHNVLQIGATEPGDLTPEVLASAGQNLTRDSRAAPITVERMDDNGGVATLDLSGCYWGVARWQRRVAWDRSAVTIEDDVELERRDVAQFRWHLGVPADAARTIGADRITVGDVILMYSGDQPIVARVEAMPNATLEPGRVTEHACIVLRTAAPVEHLRLTTRVALAHEAAVAGRERVAP